VKRFASRWAAPWLCFAIVLALLAYADPQNRAVATTQGLDFWTASASELAATAGLADFGSYAQYALFLLNGYGREPSPWYVKTWPPGFPAVAALVIGWTGESGYFVKMLAVAIAFWSVALTVVLNEVRFHPSRLVAFACIALVFLLPDLRYRALGGGSFVSDSVATALFVAALGLLGGALLRADPRLAYGSAIVFALAANCRTAYDVTINAAGYGLLILLATSWLVLLGVECLRRNVPLTWPSLRLASHAENCVTVSRATLATVIFLALFSLGTMPWKLHNHRHYGVYGFAMLESWISYWRPDQTLPTFLRGGNTACVLDPPLCRLVQSNPGIFTPRARTLQLAVFLREPAGWLAHRMSNLSWLWVGRPWVPPPDATWRDYAAYVEGAVYLAALLLSSGLLLASLRRPDLRYRRLMLLLHGAIVLLYFGANGVMFLFVHYEQRYSLPLRVMCLWSLAMVFALRRTPSADSEAPHG